MSGVDEELSTHGVFRVLSHSPSGDVLQAVLIFAVALALLAATAFALWYFFIDGNPPVPFHPESFRVWQRRHPKLAARLQGDRELEHAARTAKPDTVISAQAS